MTGARITFTFDDHEFRGALRHLRDKVRHPAPLLTDIGPKLVSNTHDRFNAGRDPWGRPWAPLNPAYAAVKKGAHILIESGMGGGLMGSITSAVEGDSVIVGSNKVYAAVHQFGATILPRQAGIPARPYLGFSDADREAVLDVLEALLPR